jgi:excisionase family DNA binding protein
MEYNMPDLIPVPEAARRAGVARNTMRLAAKKGTIKAVKLGRNWLVDASDIDRWKREVYRPDKAFRFPIASDDDSDQP